MKYLLIAFHVFLTLHLFSQRDTTLRPEGWLPCYVQRDSMLIRLEEQMNALETKQPFWKREEADVSISYLLKYQQYLIETGECRKIYVRGYVYEKWRGKAFSVDGYVEWFLGL